MVTTETRTKPTVAAVFSASRRGVATWNPTIETRSATRESRKTPAPGETSGSAGGGEESIPTASDLPEPGGPLALPDDPDAGPTEPSSGLGDSPASTGEFDDSPRQDPGDFTSTAAAEAPEVAEGAAAVGFPEDVTTAGQPEVNRPDDAGAPPDDASTTAPAPTSEPDVQPASPQAESAATAGAEGVPSPPQPSPMDLPWPSAAETPAASDEAAAWSMGADRSGTSGWGALWRQSAQGWVEDPAGRAVWRPIVTTSATLSEWEVDTYLGLVTGELAISSDNLEGGLRSARQDAVERMVDDALARGAHAVIGVSVDLVEVGGSVVVSAAGTAVTLKTSE